LKDYLVLFVISGTIVFLDQWTKNLVRNNLAFTEVFHPEWWLSQYIRIVHWQNTGAAFGLFQDMSLVFTVLAFIVAGVIIYYFPRVPPEDWLIRLAMGMQMGGALGNLVDRLTQDGIVTDFISVFNFPVFNIADASISTGVVVLFIGMWLREKKDKELQENLALIED
jgi:signal peptidase II